MKLSRFISILMVGFLLFAINCGPAQDNLDSSEDSVCDPALVHAPECPNPESFYSVMADEHLQEGHKIAVLQALNVWAEKTNNTLTYKLSFIDMSAQTPDTSVPHTIKIYVRDPGPGLVGWTSWASSNRSAFTFVEPSIDSDLFRRIMLHELGHAFNLHFGDDIHYVGPYESVMHPSIGEASSHLCCPELQAFCNEYGCQVDCMNTVKPKTNPIVNYSWKETELP